MRARPLTTRPRPDQQVVPRPRDMLFFGYLRNKTTLEMDDGHTEHSGCPLRRGTKWIATMWMREGLTPANDWTKFEV